MESARLELLKRKEWGIKVQYGIRKRENNEAIVFVTETVDLTAYGKKKPNLDTDPL